VGLRVKFAGGASVVSALFDGFTHELTTGTVQYGFHGIIRAQERRSLYVQWFGPNVDEHLYVVASKNVYALTRAEFDTAVERKFPVLLKTASTSIKHAKTSTHAATSAD
jgi:hypothetical protein